MERMEDTLFALPPLPEQDWAAHTAEQAAVWASFYGGAPTRVPMVLGVTPRVLLCDRRYNPRGITFREYMNDPDMMRRVQCEFALFRRHFLPCDQEMGLPEQWSVYVDTQNVGEAAWLGAEIEYPAWEVPDTRPCVGAVGTKRQLDRGLPEPVGRQ